MTNQDLRRSMNKVVGGSDLMGVSDFMRWGNFSKSTACEKLRGLNHVPGTKKYFIPEIIQHLRMLEATKGEN